MTAPGPTPTAQAGHAELLRDARARTLALARPVSDADLTAVHSTLMSPLVWDLAHIAAFEDLWICHRHGGLPLLRDDLMDVYDAFETPRAGRGTLEFLAPDPAREYLAAVRERTEEVLARDPGDGLVAELVLRHELQHTETMAQTLCLARLGGYSLSPLRALLGEPEPSAPASGPAPAGLELESHPGGPCLIGAGADGFAYDNERPQHVAALEPFAIGRTPVTNGEFAAFVDGGGYDREEWWSPAGWAWRRAEAVQTPGGWTGAGEWRLDGLAHRNPAAPVVHVSWYEADAFCRAHGLRLPTELEWEAACAWDAIAGARSEPDAGAANGDLVAGGTLPPDADSRSPGGCLGMLGDVWEWTASPFTGYDGFVPHPYREYSEVFFGTDYRVLRGGSWATSPRVAGASFRNWDYPQRRQIFAGFRVAR